MFTFQEGGKSYRVWFQHETNLDTLRFSMITTCNIKDLQEDKIVAIGYSRCSYKDNPNHSTGRKISLGRALKQFSPTNKEMRKRIWDAYFKKQHDDFVRGVEGSLIHVTIPAEGVSNGQ